MRFIIKYPTILLIRFLQYRYKKLSIKENNSTNQNLAKLGLLQSILYYFKCQFKAWGYFHPSCVWSEKDEKFFRWLFPQKDFEEEEITIWYNPAAVTYYHNRIFRLTGGADENYAKEIKKQLIKWKKWN